MDDAIVSLVASHAHGIPRAAGSPLRPTLGIIVSSCPDKWVDAPLSQFAGDPHVACALRSLRHCEVRESDPMGIGSGKRCGRGAFVTPSTKVLTRETNAV